MGGRELAQLKKVYYTTREAAEILKVSRQRIWWRIHNGSLEAYRSGRNWMIKATSVEALLRRKRNNWKR